MEERERKLMNVGICITTVAMIAALSGCNLAIRGSGTARIATSHDWTFAAAEASSYLYPAGIELSGGVCRLKRASLTDSDASASGFGGASLQAVTWDATLSALRLDPATSSSELSSAWTPRYSSLVGYWKLDGSGAIANWADLGSTIGSTAWAQNPDGSGMSYTRARLNQGVSMDGVDDWIDAGGSYSFSSNSATLAAWFLAPPGGTRRTIASFCGGNGSAALDISLETNGELWVSQESSVGFWAPGRRDDSRWHHVAAVRDYAAQKLRLYVDGELVQEITQSAVINPATVDRFQIGDSTCGNFQPFGGTIDEVAAWNAALTASEIRELYQRQQSRYSGRLTSRVMDVFSAQSWPELSWATTLPFLKALPDYNAGVQNETASAYPSLASDTLMSGIVALWHLDGAGALAGGATIADAAGGNNPGTALNANGSGMAYEPGRFGQAVYFDGVDDAIDVNVVDTFQVNQNDFTYSIWFNASDLSNGRALLTNHTGGQLKISLDINSGTLRGMFSNVPGPDSIVSCGSVETHRWYHVVFTGKWSDGLIRCYLNAGAPASIAYPSGQVGDTVFQNYRIGHSSQYAWPFQGWIDEIAIWQRALSSAEIQQLYRRGANRLRFQVRTCSAADCSDDPSGANWKGPGGSPATLFSEAYNRATQGVSPSGAVLPGAPSLNLGSYSSPAGSSRFFQYRVLFESDDESTGCNYGGAARCSPELRRVSAGADRYDSSGPAIQGQVPSGKMQVSRLIESLGSSCAGGVRYALSPDGSVWYWWNGSAWTIADGSSAQANDASMLTARAASYAAAFGASNVYFRAHLLSSGSTPCELDAIGLR